MDPQKYPIGIQTFEKLIEEGFAYVDKTAFIPKLVGKDRCYFLSRPRRFGKSLLLSTLHAYFDGRRDLFKGLALDSADVDWAPTPVLHFDFNSEDYSQPEGLTHILNRILREYETQYCIDNSVDSETIPGRFARLIQTVYQQTGRKVAILVDEYGKPLLGLEDAPELFERNQALLKGFFGNLKSMDRFIRFAMLTGVARFSKVSIFSDVNNLDDISINGEYADICGWTEEDLTGTFRPGIEALAMMRDEDFCTTLGAMRDFYDGYLFHEQGHRLYNPFSVLKALSAKEIEPYWFETGAPTFLARRVKKSGIPLPDLGEDYHERQELLSVGTGTGTPVSLMFQTGYLTIDRYDRDIGMYKLRFPNREVELGFAKQLYPLYVPVSPSERTFSFPNFKVDLFRGRPEAFMTRLQTLIKGLPFDLQNQGNYQSIIWLLCTLCGTETLAERHTYKGRSDLEVRTPSYVYVFGFKYNRSVEEAVAQLRERDYAGLHRLDPRTVYLIGANLSTRKPDIGLTGWHIDMA